MANGTTRFFRRKILNCKVYLLTKTYLEVGTAHAATDQMRKTPTRKTAADHVLMNICDRLDHHASSDLRRATPISGRIKAEATDMTLRILKATGDDAPGAAPRARHRTPIESLTPPTNRFEIARSIRTGSSSEERPVPKNPHAGCETRNPDDY